MINECFHCRNEENGMRQTSMLLKRCGIAPVRMNVELIGVADRLERMVAKATCFFAGGTLNVANRVAQRRPATGASMKAGKEKNPLRIVRRHSSPAGAHWW